MPPRKSLADKIRKPLLYLIVALFLSAGTLYYYVKGESTAPGYGKWAEDYDVRGMEVHFIDVGQGDCTLLLCGDSAVLIDGGEYIAGQHITEYLKAHGVEKLELMVATHRHSDHIHGLASVLKEYEVDEILINQNGLSDNVDSTAETDFLQAAQDNGATVTFSSHALSYEFDNMRLTVISDALEHADENEHCIVMKAEYEDVSLLLTGDIGSFAEEALLQADLNLDCDILKVAHHGSGNSSTDEFLTAITPSVAVISCGARNFYGHPSDDTLQRLQAVGAKVYRTDRMSDLAFSCYDNNIELIFRKEM